MGIKTWEIRNNEHLARSISGSFRHYMGFIHGFIDRKNPYVPNPHERWSRARTRLARGFFKLSLFHVVASTFPQLSGKGASMFWHEETNGHTSRAIVSLLMGFSIYFWMGGLADIIFTLVELILKVRTRDMFNQPYLSTSLRAFWRWRWNATVQESLEKAVTTDGVEDSVRYTEDQSERKQKQAGPRKGVVMRRPFRDVALAAFKVFFLSGVLHDHVNWIAFGDAPYRNIIFFMLQFVVVALEMGLSKSLIYKSMPSLVRWSAVVLFAAWTGPTFVGPYMRNGGLAIFPMPKWGMPAWWPTLTL
ncbi:hypothetical protein DFS34DRAFT_62235 [Phlyctochytrium arcticum]|nr:hypothetical protein DFS34DRAFT_62235 [Phlyctochytrium arcticum]